MDVGRVCACVCGGRGGEGRNRKWKDPYLGRMNRRTDNNDNKSGKSERKRKGAIEIAFPMERLGKGDRGGWRICNVTC